MMGPLRVVIAGDHMTQLRDLLERGGVRVVAEAETEEKAVVLADERAASAIVHGGMPRTSCSDLIPTIVVGDDADLVEGAALGAFAVMPAGCSDVQLAAALEVAVARCSELQKARHETDALREQLEARKLIERAKGILMSRLRIGEDDAYRRLQRASQDENRKMRDIAESILATEKILGVAPEPERSSSTG